MFRSSRCSRCSNRLECHCGTFDRWHEARCDLRSSVCSDCYEAEIDAVPIGPEPDPYVDHVKDLTMVELDALVLEHAHALLRSSPHRALQSF